MIPITYPHDLPQLQNDYYSIFSSDPSVASIQRTLSRVVLPDGSNLNLKKILCGTFPELIEYNQAIRLRYPGNRVKWQFFDYKKYSGEIANFFLQQEFKLSSCYYCNIDFINAYSNTHGDYVDSIDFINNADEHDLCLMNGIGPITAQDIIRERNGTFVTNHSFLRGFSRNWKTVRNCLDNFNIGSEKHHFTLDHFLPQKHYKYLSLSLFNFVPSCYSCNSKIKQAVDFNSASVSRISPTSNSFSLAKDAEFLILYNGDLEDIKRTSQFTLELDINRTHHANISAYLEHMRIMGRYRFHKDEVLEILRNHVDYSDAKIEEIADLTGLDEYQVRKDVFGTELFEDTEKIRPLTKLKRDIARDIGVKGIL